MPKIIKSRTLIFLFFIGLSYLLPVIYQDIIGFLLILSIGVIHGSNDLLIIKKYTKKDSLKSQIFYFLFYLGLFFLGFLFFSSFPSIALLSFVLVSIYHFGIEQGFFQESSVCGVKSLTEIITKEDLLKQLSEKTISCKDVTFRIFGLSLTSINIVISLLFIITLLKIFKKYEKNK